MDRRLIVVTSLLIAEAHPEAHTSPEDGAPSLPRAGRSSRGATNEPTGCGLFIETVTESRGTGTRSHPWRTVWPPTILRAR